MREIDFYFRGRRTRQQLRSLVVRKFLGEEPGLGRGPMSSRYRYNVERLGDGRRIYLSRPAYLKKGFDFRINVESEKFLTGREYPKHDDILLDLKRKHEEEPERYQHLRRAMTQVYRCWDPNDLLPRIASLSFSSGHTPELILKVLKWFWIEQDIRDWNYSGRLMLWEAIQAIRE